MPPHRWMVHDTDEPERGQGRLGEGAESGVDVAQILGVTEETLAAPLSPARRPRGGDARPLTVPELAALRPVLPPQPPIWSDAGLARLYSSATLAAVELPGRGKRCQEARPVASAHRAITLERPRVEAGALRRRRRSTLIAALGIGTGMVIALLGLLIVLAVVAGPTSGTSGGMPANTTLVGALAAAVRAALAQIPGLAH